MTAVLVVVGLALFGVALGQYPPIGYPPHVPRRDIDQWRADGIHRVPLSRDDGGVNLLPGSEEGRQRSKIGHGAIYGGRWDGGRKIPLIHGLQGLDEGIQQIRFGHGDRYGGRWYGGRIGRGTHRLPGSEGGRHTRRVDRFGRKIEDGRNPRRNDGQIIETIPLFEDNGIESQRFPGFEGGRRRGNGFGQEIYGLPGSNRYRIGVTVFPGSEGGLRRGTGYPGSEGGYRRGTGFAGTEGGYRRGTGFAGTEGGLRRSTGYPGSEGGLRRGTGLEDLFGQRTSKRRNRDGYGQGRYRPAQQWYDERPLGRTSLSGSEESMNGDYQRQYESLGWEGGIRGWRGTGIGQGRYGGLYGSERYDDRFTPRRRVGGYGRSQSQDQDVSDEYNDIMHNYPGPYW